MEWKDFSPLHATIEMYEQFLQFWTELDNLVLFSSHFSNFIWQQSYKYIT